ncbi:MAG: hypothetical protein VX589_14595 [Myxococcota bacterium]|nr:hypothetical protein [Myxococcota bacterium]
MVKAYRIAILVCVTSIVVWGCQSTSDGGGMSGTAGETAATGGSSAADMSDSAGETAATGGNSAADMSDSAGGSDDAVVTAPGVEVGPPDIIGTFTDGSGTHTVADGKWTQTYDGVDSVFNFISVDNQAQSLIAQNAAENAFSPNLFSRMDWIWHSEGLFYCTIVFDSESAEAAKNAPAANAETPAESGCNTFPWSALTPQPATSIVGTYTDGFSQQHVIGERTWVQTFEETPSVFIVVDVKETPDGGVLIARNLSLSDKGEPQWSRFDWLKQGEKLYYCQSRYDASSRADAIASESASSDDLEKGCNGFSWSELTAP